MAHQTWQRSKTMKNMNDSCWNKTILCQDDAFWYITRSYEHFCWEFEQNKNEFLFWPLRPRIFRIACGYILHSLIFLHSLCIFRFWNANNEYCCLRKNIYLSEVSAFYYLDLKYTKIMLATQLAWPSEWPFCNQHVGH